MELFVCDMCSYESKFKHNYNNHLKTQKHVDNEKKIGVKCILCNVYCKTKGNLTNHMKWCKQKSSNDSNIVKQLVNKVNELRTKIKENELTFNTF